MVAVLAGGTGGARLARGMLDVVGAGARGHRQHRRRPRDLRGARLAGSGPDRLRARRRARRPGLRDRRDTWAVMDELGAAGRDTWFRLGDRDLALCLLRTELLRSACASPRPTPRSWRGLGLRARRPPDVRRAGAHARARERAAAVLPGVHDPRPRGGSDRGGRAAGIEEAQPAPDVLEAIAAAEAIVIGPSNPVISIGPILAVPGCERRWRRRTRRSSP